MPEVLSGEDRIPHGIIMPFFDHVFILYPNVSSIQERLHENGNRLSCVIELNQAIEPSQKEEIRKGIVVLIRQHISPEIPIDSVDITFKTKNSRDDGFSPEVAEACARFKSAFNDPLREPVIPLSVLGGIAGALQFLFKRISPTR